MPPLQAAAPLRFERLDAVRGAAMVWMAAFHFGFDLNYFRFTRQNFYEDPFWTVQRTCIVVLFFGCAGLGQAIALRQGAVWPPGRRFWLRWGQIAGCALLVSAGSWLMFPQSFITFGVLHFMAVALLLLRFGAALGRWLWPLGLVALAWPHVMQSAWFDSRWTNWVGLTTHKPVTEDYAPLLPWIGVMAWAFAAGTWVLAHRPQWLAGPVPRMAVPLAVLGRWSLTFYMLHQPLLIGVLAAVTALR